jgi:hypothetical protein
MVEYIRGEWNYIVRANGLAVVYSMDEPEDLLTAGKVVDFNDFHEAARFLGLSKVVGTTAFKKTISHLAEDEYPFVFVPDLVGNTSISTNFGYVGIELKNFYIRTQALHDYVVELSQLPDNQRQPHTPKSFAVLREVIFEDSEVV